MLIFSVSDKGGTGRSVTSCNIAYHLAQREDIAYLDFDFGSPTAGAIFEMTKVEKGIDEGGLHSYVEGAIARPRQVDVWSTTSHANLGKSGMYANRLVLFPGDRGGSEFSANQSRINRCISLFTRLEREFAVTIVDLSAGRSHAVEMVLAATASIEMTSVTARWLVFHRWTRQHIMAAHNLIFEPRGLLDIGVTAGHRKTVLNDAIRTVRTAVPDLSTRRTSDNPAQAAWLRSCNQQLDKLSKEKALGPSRMLGQTPVEPMLQWREQIILGADVAKKIANEKTFDSFRDLAARVTDDAEWDKF